MGVIKSMGRCFFPGWILLADVDLMCYSWRPIILVIGTDQLCSTDKSKTPENVVFCLVIGGLLYCVIVVTPVHKKLIVIIDIMIQDSIEDSYCSILLLVPYIYCGRQLWRYQWHARKPRDERDSISWYSLKQLFLLYDHGVFILHQLSIRLLDCMYHLQCFSDTVQLIKKYVVASRNSIMTHAKTAVETRFVAFLSALQGARARSFECCGVAMNPALYSPVVSSFSKENVACHINFGYSHWAPCQLDAFL